MRVFALSDIHIDYSDNARWVDNLSVCDLTEDVLILAGDISSSLSQLQSCLKTLRRKFHAVLYTPGNHDLWIEQSEEMATSIEKFALLRRVVSEAGVMMDVFHRKELSIVPLLSWYDFSFGVPCNDLMRVWMDFQVCRWPDGFGPPEIAQYFASLNSIAIETTNKHIISFSHFLPRIDLLPHHQTQKYRFLDPVMGSSILGRQVKQLASNLHVYGHSHINRRVEHDGVTYINNAFGYPHEEKISRKRMLCVYDT